MSVMDGRRFKFMPVEGGYYAVSAVAVSRTLVPVHVLLGVVLRDRRSTDSRIAGTRLRRAGKGAACWRAQVPRDQWEPRKDRRTGEPVPGLTTRTAGQLQETYSGGFRLEESGQSWDRREEAAAALARWYDERSIRTQILESLPEDVRSAPNVAELVDVMVADYERLARAEDGDE